MTPISCTGTRTVPPPSPGMRTCCMLSPAHTIVEPGTLGTHRADTDSDVYGPMYTCAGGFIDIAHLRDLVDLTRYYHHWLTVGGKNSAGDSFSPFHYRGKVTIKATVPAAQRIDVARSMAYDHSVFHEIYSYWNKVTGMHNSAFSPEDLVSNYLGTYVGGLALAAGGVFDTAVTTALNTLLADLGARPAADTRATFSLIIGRWITGSGVLDLRSNDYLRRRNFDVRPINPWLVPGAPGCAVTTWPVHVPKEIPLGISGLYEMDLAVPIIWLTGAMGKSRLLNSAFPAEIARIETNAALPPPAGYGPNYKIPWP